MKTSRLIPLTFALAAALPLTAHAHKAEFALDHAFYRAGQLRHREFR